MAVKNIAVTDSLETFRTTFSDLAAQDFGDIANLLGAITSTNLVDAMNETISIATSTAGWTIEDSSSTQQIIGGGNILRVFGTSNEIEAVVSATDTQTIGLPSAVSVTTSLTAPTISTGNMSLTNGSITDTSGTISFGDENLTSTGTITGATITGTGATHTLGTVEISGNTLRSTDSTRLNVNDTFRVNALESQTGLVTIDENSSIPRITSSATGKALTVDAVPLFNSSIEFDGSTAGTNKTTVSVTDPTANNTITIPDETGTVITTGSTDAVTEAMMANDAIGQDELKSVVQLVIYNSSGVALKTLYGAGA